MKSFRWVRVIVSIRHPICTTFDYLTSPNNPLGLWTSKEAIHIRGKLQKECYMESRYNAWKCREQVSWNRKMLATSIRWNHKKCTLYHPSTLIILSCLARVMKCFRCSWTSVHLALGLLESPRISWGGEVLSEWQDLERNLWKWDLKRGRAMKECKSFGLPKLPNSSGS